MPDYVYLLENRLSADQRNALTHLREAARDAEMILFLTGDAVRDLTSGHAVRDLEISVHGNALKLKKPLEKAGASIWGQDETSRSLYLCFPGTVRVDVISTHRVEYPKPGKLVYHPASIQEDLRRRDFTVNAMAISLNEGSFGLLMDPLNGVADIEMRALRLASNYGFLEDPSLLIRATRYRARLSWELDPRTQTRYENAKMEGVIEHLSDHARSRELEQIGHEEEGLKVLRALEEEGWMKFLYPAWTAAKADEAKLQALHELAAEFQMQGVHPDVSAAQMELLTSGMSSKDISGLKKSLLRPGFVEEWDKLDAMAGGFEKVLLSKQNAIPSATYKLFMSYDPEAILWLGFTSKKPAVQEKYQNFLKTWPEARQRIPYALMQEMRITPDLPRYQEVVQGIFLELIDGRLTTPEELRAYLEPFSPPPPPPQVTVKRTRGRRAEKIKELEEEQEEEEALPVDDELDDMGGDGEELEPAFAKVLQVDEDEDVEEIDEDENGDEEENEPVPVPRGRAKVAAEPQPKHAKADLPAKAEPPAKPEPAAKPKAEKIVPQPPAKVQTKPAKPAPVARQTSAAKGKPAAKAKPASSAARKSPAHITGKGGKPIHKPAQKSAPTKPAPKKVKPAPAKKSKPAHAAKTAHAAKPAHAAKTAHKKPAHKPAKKR